MDNLDQTDWRSLAAEASHAMSKARIWNGQGWHYNPLPTLHYVPVLLKLQDAFNREQQAHDAKGGAQ